ncbi:hypothetical protein Sango_0172300 [Sesamum angolense]|uniref:SOSEKI DIX-like domain-containing protein n=1 Tax=Sesamum angolense TaxID=2727404 RepID=A0AAE1XFU0_9LAMI|nr:hypothetical protein Sango_0172300 [Sesamum angolense]
MEAQGGAEVRRLHIVYFLSRKGRIEHPHLVRVHHLSRNGVRLRDVKRWLGELRGKDMPESFLGRIKDNEYVLKGSEISSSNIKDDSGKPEMEKNSDATKHEKPDNRTDHRSPTLGQKNKKRSSKVTINENITTSSTAADASKIPSSEPQFTKSKSYSNGASHIFRNLISCGAVETNDSAVVAVNKQNRPTFLNMCASDASSVQSAQICKRDGLGGSQRVLQTPHWIQQQWTGSWKGFDGVQDSAKNKSEVRDQRATSAAYKPVNGPTCSQQNFVGSDDTMWEAIQAGETACTYEILQGNQALSKGAANAAISAAEKASKGSTTGFRIVTRFPAIC